MTVAGNPFRPGCRDAALDGRVRSTGVQEIPDRHGSIPGHAQKACGIQGQICYRQVSAALRIHTPVTT
jgi:hypothetical protein